LNYSEKRQSQILRTKRNYAWQSQILRTKRNYAYCISYNLLLYKSTSISRSSRVLIVGSARNQLTIKLWEQAYKTISKEFDSSALIAEETKSCR